MPPKKKVIPYDAPLQSRPQRNMRAKKVFDPSDSYLPKKKIKLSSYPVKNETTNKKRKKPQRKKKNRVTKPKSKPVNNSVDSSVDIIKSPVRSPSHSPVIQNSPVKQSSPKLVKESSDICFLCSQITLKHELVDCPICMTKAHKDCIIVEEPIWRFKLDKCPWLCKQCREKHCSKCLKDESFWDITLRCITCKVGLHLSCYESYDIKPLHAVHMNMYVCIPCMTLAIQKLPEEEEEEEEEEEKEEDIEIGEKPATSVHLKSSSEEDELNSINSSTSLDFEEFENDFSNPIITNTSGWSKYKVYEYLSEFLPKEILLKIIKNDIDGHALQLLKRSDITTGMGLKLGPALKLYKQVRILQTQSTYHGVYWE